MSRNRILIVDDEPAIRQMVAVALELADFDVLEALAAFAIARGFNLLTLAVSWLASQPTVVSVISGAARVDQLNQNVAAAGWKITADDLAQIDRIVGRP